MKLVERYTLEKYASAFEIQNDFSIGSQIILEEIENYREKYRLYFYYQDQPYSLVLTPKIKQLMNQYYIHDNSNELHPYIQIFMLRNEDEICKKCIQYYQLPLELFDTFNYIYSYESDITKSFLEWLEHLSTFSFIKMIEYEYKILCLPKKQQEFLKKHDSYFTIEQYQKECHISYETARLHLCNLHKEKIISKHKIGKKHVYKGEI